MIFYGVVDDGLEEAIELFVDRKDGERMVENLETAMSPTVSASFASSRSCSFRRVSR